jgi:hypothetical protein
MRRERRGPLRDRLFGCRAGGAAVEKQVAFAVAAKEVALPSHVDRCGPAVTVNRHGLTRRDPDFQNAHAVIFEHEAVVFRGRDHRVQRIRPRPLLWVCAHGVLPVLLP